MRLPRKAKKLLSTTLDASSRRTKRNRKRLYQILKYLGVSSEDRMKLNNESASEASC